MYKLYRNFKNSISSIQWDRTWDEEKKVLFRLKKERDKLPNSSIFDSKMQYKAQVDHLGFFKRAVLQIVSFLGFIFLLIKNLSPVSFEDKFDAAFSYSTSIFPKKVMERKKLIRIEPRDGYLDFQDLVFLFSLLLKLNFNFAVLAIATYRIANCKYAIAKYSVSEIWSNMEYSCSSGILKRYLNKNGIQLINFMHGEKVLTIRDSFCRFDKMYFWNKHYVNIFKKLNYKDPYEIVDPFLSEKSTSWKKESTFCYILRGTETNSEINKLVTILNILRGSGFVVAVKPHPRYPTDLDKLKHFQILDSVTVKKMLDEYYHICAQYSTILHEANLNGNHIIVDNLSNRKLYKKLKERNYDKLRDEYCYLSKFIKKTDNYDSLPF